MGVDNDILANGSGTAAVLLQQMAIPVPVVEPGVSPLSGAMNATVGREIPAELHEPHMPPSIMTALRSHGPGWFASIARQLMWARIQLRNCTHLGKWVRVRGRVRVHNEGTIVIGNRVRFRAETALSELVTWGDGRIEIGDATTINYGSSISAAGMVHIGNDCLIGTYVNIMDSNFHNESDRSWSLASEPVTIGDRVWLGNRCVIMQGVTIGDGAIVAACSLVTRDVPANSMVVGVPARVVKHLG
jgi:acetyltransferase-like isoleucine patch superfamily enzyme